MKRLLSLAAALALLLTGCRQAPAPTPTPALSAEDHLDANFFAMDTLMSFTVYGPKAREGLDAAEARVNGLDSLLSVTDENSQVWQLNHAGGKSIDADDDLVNILTAAQGMGRSTAGALDVTLYPVVKAWGFTTGEYQIPEEEVLSGLLENVDYRAVSVREGRVSLPEGMEVDFGAIAKGYAGEVCAAMLRELGVESAILRLSGNIQTVGAKPDGSPWRIGIQNPNGEASDNVGVLELVDQAAVTSGGYQRYFEEDGVRYWHIIDPATGAPARSGLTSVTIVADSGTACDGLSTALFVMGLEDGLAYWRAHRDFECILMDEDMGLWITAGLADAFAPIENTGYTLHIVEE